MKASIKLTALFLLFSSAIFAANKTKSGDSPAKDEITFSSLPSLKGVDVKVAGAGPVKAIVSIYDQNDNLIFKDYLPTGKSMEKGYILNQLDLGDYTFEVETNHQVVKKDIHIYAEQEAKVFIVKE